MYAKTAYEAVRDADALLVVTEWDEFKELDMRRVCSLMNSPILVDGRNLYGPEEMIKEGFIYEGVGRRGTGYRKAEAVEPALSGATSSQGS